MSFAAADNTCSLVPTHLCPFSSFLSTITPFFQRVVFPDPLGELASCLIVCRSQIRFPDARARGRPRCVYFCCFHLSSVLSSLSRRAGVVFPLICVTRLIYWPGKRCDVVFSFRKGFFRGCLTPCVGTLPFFEAGVWGEVGLLVFHTFGCQTQLNREDTRLDSRALLTFY